MTPSQIALRKITDELEEVERRSAEILSAEEIGDEAHEEIRSLAEKKKKLIERRSAVRLLLDEDDAKSVVLIEPDAEMRERLELRSKASLTGFLRAAIAGRRADGAEAELQAAAGIGDGIPLELWDTPDTRETRADAATGAPGTVGVNLDRIRPAVFANSIAPSLGIEMPRVESGTYASAIITTNLTAASKAKGGPQEASAAGFTVTSVTPKRISARLGIRIEDVAAVGVGNFESILRENLSLVLSDELDDQVINGAGGNSGADLEGIFHKLTPDPTDPTDVADFDAFVAAFAGGVDGLWANTLKDVSIVCGPATYKLSAQSFRDVGTNNGHRGDVAFSAALRDGPIRRLVDEQAHARRGIEHPASSPLQEGPIHDGRRRGDEDGGLPALERNQHR